MAWSLLLPASAVVIALTLYALSLGRVEHELQLLRRTLRRTQAVAMAADELDRRTAQVAARAAEVDADARALLRRRARRERRADRRSANDR